MPDIITSSTEYIIPKKDNHSKVEVEIGDVKQPIFYPQVKIKNWDNETNFSVRLNEDVTGSTNELKGSIINWKSADQKKEVNIYELDASSPEFEDGGLEFEIILYERPINNIVTFSIETKGLKFTKQIDPKDLPANIRDMVDPPDNVIGSYAVYHKYQKHDLSKIGGQNYKTGKAFHIYRPKIEDSDGNWTWGDLNIDTTAKVLTVTIPQEFLDNAIYPIKHAAGLTLGYTSIGGTPVGFAGSGTAIYSYGGNPSVDGTASKITAYLYLFSAGSNNFKGAIWNSTTLISNGVSAAVNVSSTSPSWYDSVYSTEPSLTTGGDYNIGVISDSGNLITRADNAGTTGLGDIDLGNNYASPQNLGGGVVVLDPSVYATYEGIPGYGNNVNTVAAANIGSINGVATANIESVDGV